MIMNGNILYNVIKEFFRMDENFINDYVKELHNKNILVLNTIDCDYVFNKINELDLDLKLKKKILDSLNEVRQMRNVTLLDLLSALYINLCQDCFVAFFESINQDELFSRKISDIVNHLKNYYYGKSKEIDVCIDKLENILYMCGEDYVINDKTLFNILRKYISIENDYFIDICKDFGLSIDPRLKYKDDKNKEKDYNISLDELKEKAEKYKYNSDIIKDSLIDKLVTDNIVEKMNGLGCDVVSVSCLGAKDNVYFYLVKFIKEDKKERTIYIPIKLQEYSILNTADDFNPTVFMSNDKKYNLNEKGLKEFYIDELVKLKKMQKQILDEMRLPYYDDSLRYLDLDNEKEVVTEESIKEKEKRENDEMYNKFLSFFSENFSNKTIDYVRKSIDFLKEKLKNKLSSPSILVHCDADGQNAIVFEVKGFGPNGKIVCYVVVDSEDGESLYIDKVIFNGKIYDYNDSTFDKIIYEDSDDKIINPLLVKDSLQDLKQSLTKALKRGNLGLVKKILKLIKKNFGDIQYNIAKEEVEDFIENSDIEFYDDKLPNMNKIFL